MALLRTSSIFFPGLVRPGNNETKYRKVTENQSRKLSRVFNFSVLKCVGSKAVHLYTLFPKW